MRRRRRPTAKEPPDAHPTALPTPPRRGRPGRRPPRPGRGLHPRRVKRRQVILVGPGDLKLQANAVKGGKNATEATWLQDWVIPNFQKMMADQGKQVTVQYVCTGADDEDVKTQLALDLRTGAGPDVLTPDGPWVGEFAQAGFLLIIFFLGQRYFVEGIATTGRKG